MNNQSNLLKSKISNQNLLSESDIKNVDNTNNILDQLKDINQTFKNSNNELNNILNSIENYINSKNSNNFTDSFMNLIHDLNNSIQNMTIHQQLSFLHISGSLFILTSLFSILTIFYGDYLIIKLNLESKFPSFAKFIRLRRKFQQYYILLDVIISSIILLIIIYINIILIIKL
jgi:ABC-type multidrug transport system permease subunit